MFPSFCHLLWTGNKSSSSSSSSSARTYLRAHTAFHHSARPRCLPFSSRRCAYMPSVGLEHLGNVRHVGRVRTHIHVYAAGGVTAEDMVAGDRAAGKHVRPRKYLTLRHEVVIAGAPVRDS